jgi:hypothetical protein
MLDMVLLPLEFLERFLRHAPNKPPAKAGDIDVTRIPPNWSVIVKS